MHDCINITHSELDCNYWLRFASCEILCSSQCLQINKLHRGWIKLIRNGLHLWIRLWDCCSHNSLKQWFSTRGLGPTIGASANFQ